MFRPAGESDDDDDSELECFGFSLPDTNNHVNQVREPVRTPNEKLFDAVDDKSVDKTRAALAEGADIHARCRDNSAIMAAALMGDYDVLVCLIQEGADVNDQHNMFTVVMCLCNSYSKDEAVLLKCLKLLVEHGANHLAKDWLSCSALIHAVRRNHLLLVSHLLEIGCDVNGADCDGCTPIFYAAQNSNLAIAKILIDSGAAIDVTDRTGRRLEDIPQVSENPELAALFGIEIKDDEPGPAINPLRSYYKQIMTYVPSKNDRLKGYHPEAVRFAKGIGLWSVAELIEDKNIQLAHLLTWGCDDWKRSGLHLTYYARKISLCVRKYHERPWSKSAIPVVSKVVSNDEVDLFPVVILLMDLLRFTHITSVTSLYYRLNFDNQLSNEAVLSMNDIQKDLTIAEKQLATIKRLCVALDGLTTVTPPDLIKSKPITYNRNITLKFGVFLVGLVIVYKCRFLR